METRESDGGGRGVWGVGGVVSECETGSSERQGVCEGTKELIQFHSCER